jgi:hypothetical protein
MDAKAFSKHWPLSPRGLPRLEGARESKSDSLKRMSRCRTGPRLQRICDRSPCFALKQESRLRHPLRARTKGFGARQRAQLRGVGRFLVGDIYLLRIRVRHGPIATRIQRRGRSLKKIERGHSPFPSPLSGVQPSNDQMWPGMSVQEVLPFHYRHCRHALLERAQPLQTKARPGTWQTRTGLSPAGTSTARSVGAQQWGEAGSNVMTSRPKLRGV